MDKLRVAIIMEDCRPAEGGGYTYYQTLLTAIDRHTFHPDLEIINVNFDKNTPEHLKLSKPVIYVKKTFAGQVVYEFFKQLYRLVHYIFQTNARCLLESISEITDGINHRAARKLLEKEKIHLVYYLKPQENLVDYPMIITHWDVGHKSMYPFPEVAWNGNFEKREKYYENILHKAFLILCESETGANELQKYYPVNLDKVRVLPLFGGDVLNQAVSEAEQEHTLTAYHLVKGEFFVYPAQFWAHKNHSTLLQAFQALWQHPGNESLKLILCGGDQGNLSYIMEMITSLGIEKNIVLPGFITNKNLYALYKNAVALIMPTFLGPTNIPLIEAAQLKCAVLCSDLPGHREILGESALYFDPSSSGDIERCLQQILNIELRTQLASSAYIRIKDSNFQVEKSIPLLDIFLQKIRPIRKAWGINFKFLLAVAKIGILSLN